MRKKQAMHLDARYVTMVENAYYYCNPPPAEKTVKKKRLTLNILLNWFPTEMLSILIPNIERYSTWFIKQIITDLQETRNFIDY